MCNTRHALRRGRHASCCGGAEIVELSSQLEKTFILRLWTRFFHSKKRRLGLKKRKHGAVQRSGQRGGQSHAADEEAREGAGTAGAAQAEDRRGELKATSISVCLLLLYFALLFLSSGH